MFFIGQLNPTITLTAVQTDIIKLVTGTATTAAQLTSFTTSTVSIVSTVAPGWSVVDSAVGAAVNGVVPQVISAPWSDDATKFKNISITSVLANQLAFNGYETWNATNHTGTNPHVTTPASGTWQAIPFTANSWVVISASATHIFVYAFTSSVLSTTAPASAYQFFASEYTREDSWNTVANGYPSWFSHGTNAGSITVPTDNLVVQRIYNTANKVDLPSQIAITGASQTDSVLMARISTPNCPGGSGGQGRTGLGNLNGLSQGYGANGSSADKTQYTHVLTPLRLSPWIGANISLGIQSYGSITDKSPFVYSFKNLWQNGDEVVIDGVTYMILALTTANNFIAIKEA